MKRLSIILLSITLLLSSAPGYAQLDFNQQIKRVSDSLASKLSKTSKKRVAVANFLDLQDNPTELGKYLAEALSVELTNTSLEVIDRTRMNDLIKELKLSESKLTVGNNALKLGELAGIEFIITGTITLLDNSVDITFKALDIQRGVSIAGMRAEVPRTNAINNLLRSTISSSGGEAANVYVTRKIDANDQAATDDIFNTRISDLRTSECVVKDRYGKTYFMGQICFENQLGEDILFFSLDSGLDGWLESYITGIPAGSRGCSVKIPVNMTDPNATAMEAKFQFYTPDGSKRVKVTFTLEKCKVKSVVLTKKNLMLLSSR